MQQITDSMTKTIHQAGLHPLRAEDRECGIHGEYRCRIFHAGGVDRESGCPKCFFERTRTMSEQAGRECYRHQVDANRKSLVEKLGHAGIPDRFIQFGFSNYDARTPQQQQALHVSKTYAQNFASNLQQGRGIIFVGTTGTGKTHLSCSIGKHVIKTGGTAVFISMLEAIQMVKESYRPGAEKSERDVINEFVTPDLLVLDDAGVQYGTEAERVIVTSIINRRYESLRPVILSSNMTTDELDRILGQRVMSRLRQVNDLVICKWEDYRARA